MTAASGCFPADARQLMGAPIFGRQLVALRAGRAAGDAARACATASCHGRSSVIGPSTANTPRSWSVTMR